MIIGMQGFSSFAGANIINDSDINQMLANVRSTHPRDDIGQLLGRFQHYSTSPSVSLSPPQLSASVGGTNSYFTFQNQTTGWIKEVGDTLTVGARLLIQSVHANTNPVVAGFSGNNAPSSPLDAIVVMDDKSTTPYVEIEVSMTNDPTNPYRFRGWVNGVLKLHTVRPNLLTYGYIGSSTPWRSGAVSAGTVIFKDIYWAFNKTGEEERVGPCTVASVPRTVKTGADNPGGENITSARSTWMMTIGSTPPITLNTPVVMGPNWDLAQNVRVKAMKMTTIGKPSIVGVSANVTSQIVDHTDKVVASESVENITANYASGVSVVTFDTSDLSMTDIRNFKFVASREKPSNVK